jgi:hypothetical protein
MQFSQFLRSVPLGYKYTTVHIQFQNYSLTSEKKYQHVMGLKQKCTFFFQLIVEKCSAHVPFVLRFSCFSSVLPGKCWDSTPVYHCSYTISKLQSYLRDKMSTLNGFEAEMHIFSINYGKMFSSCTIYPEVFMFFLSYSRQMLG